MPFLISRRSPLGTAVSCGFVLALGFAAAGCASQASPPVPPTKISSTPPAQVVNVVGSSSDCTVDPGLVHAGRIIVKARAVGKRQVAVIVYGPRDGQFNLPIAEIPYMKPGTSGTKQTTLGVGAYEVACTVKHRVHRARLNAV